MQFYINKPCYYYIISLTNTACFESLCSLTFVFVSILNLVLFCSTLPVTLLVVALFLSQSFLLCFAQHLELLCSLTVSVPAKSPRPANIYPPQLPAPVPLTCTRATYLRPALNRLSCLGVAFFATDPALGLIM